MDIYFLFTINGSFVYKRNHIRNGKSGKCLKSNGFFGSCLMALMFLMPVKFKKYDTNSHLQLTWYF